MAVLAVGCGESGTSPRCIAGSTNACLCVGGQTGVRVCSTEGAYGGCVCGTPGMVGRPVFGVGGFDSTRLYWAAPSGPGTAGGIYYASVGAVGVRQ